LLAMVVNDNAGELDKRGALESIASRLAPTVSRECVKNLFYCLCFTRSPVPHSPTDTHKSSATANRNPLSAKLVAQAVDVGGQRPGRGHFFVNRTIQVAPSCRLPMIIPGIKKPAISAGFFTSEKNLCTFLWDLSF
jgi:hypothetical protein